MVIDWDKYTNENALMIASNRFVADVLAYLEPERILEVGCNIGNNMKELANKLECHGLDNNTHALMIGEQSNPHIHFKFGDALSLPYQKNEFDLVFCSGLLTHLLEADALQVINEMIRISKQYILVMEPCGQSKQVWREGYVYLRYYEKLLANLGLDILINKEMPDLQTWKMRLYLCQKKQ